MLTAHISDLISGSYWLTTFGSAATVAVILIIFAETGLFLGFFLPGDSLLVLAGIYSVHHAGAKPGDPHLNLGLLLPGVIIASIVGSQLGYWLGRRAGDTLFHRPDSRFFKQEYVDRTREVLE
jgi:membrane-associated protein